MKKHILAILALSVIALACTKGGAWDGSGEYKGEAGGDYAMDGEMAGDFGGDSDPGEGENGNSNAGVLTAGEWNDLRNWTYWAQLLNNQQNGFGEKPAYWKFYTQGRVAVHVDNADGSPAVNVPLELYYNDVREWEARTDNHGDASLWLGLYEMPATVDSTALCLVAGGQEVEGVPLITAFRDTAVLINKVSLAQSVAASKKADIAFIVDATGSMGDEISFLKQDLLDILNKVKTDQSGVAIRTGAIFYRDEGDEYVTKASGLNANLNELMDFIRDQRADGGGDYPEAVHTALAKTLQDLAWDAEARNRIAFLILDAPAHYETKVIESLHNSVQLFAKNGIRIIPVAASGVDKNTEFMCRFFAIATGGTYTFLTNDSGVGGDHIEASVGEYKVEQLNSLIYRLIIEYIE